MRLAGGFTTALIFAGLSGWVGSQPDSPRYVKRADRVQTVLPLLRASGLPTLTGKWYSIGPFPNKLGDFEKSHPPEKEIDLAKTYPGADGRPVGWIEFPGFRIGKIVNLARYEKNDHVAVYLYHEIEVPRAMSLPISLGSDDSLVVWLNGEELISQNVERAAAPDQEQAVLKLKAGKNRLLLRVGNTAGPWAVYVAPDLPDTFDPKIRQRLAADFPRSTSSDASSLSAEAAHYRMVTWPLPKHLIMEVGGLAFRADGKLLACTRRGEVWLVSNPDTEDLAKIDYKLFATGLHEALGLCVDGKDVYVVQRPELTKLVDADGDDVADEYHTVCNKWGVSGDYHEFAFGPARDRQGNFYVTLNVGFGGGHQSKTPWRGWCVKVSPEGELTPFATGLRSPNGINFSPDGALFYCDNQGEWVATNKMHEIRPGEFYGHHAGLRWVPQSPFADLLKTTYPWGMLYDGQAGAKQVKGMPPHTPPCIWFPYGRMGQSASEPIWDTTKGKFGPFAGQCFVGDQTKSNVMRVYLEKINGRYQGACFPFRGGFQCGINRLAFGPDGSLFAGQTNRGWGSVGPKAYGLQRLVYTGLLPFEIQVMKLTKTGFDLTFTKPLDAKTAAAASAYSLQSFTYNYWPTYGSPEVDRKAEKVQAVRVSDDRKTASLRVDGFRRGRVYELRLEGVRAEEGGPVLHPEAYYTLNDLP
jgi:hypothetical protein